MFALTFGDIKRYFECFLNILCNCLHRVYFFSTLLTTNNR